MRTLHLIACVATSGLLLSGSASAGGWLGVTLEPPHGVQVAEIFKNSPADQNGIENGDLIVAMDGVTIRSIEQFMAILAQTAPGTKVTLAMLRNGKAMERKVTLDNAEEHRSFFQGTQNAWRTPSEGNLMQPSRPTYFGEQEPGHHPTHFSSPKEWPSYRPPREKQFLPPPPPSAWLGIAPGAANDGVEVLGVAPNSPAEQAELKTGDIITAINRQTFTSPRALVRAIGIMRPGDLVEISFTRKGRIHMMQVPLQSPPSTP